MTSSRPAPRRIVIEASRVCEAGQHSACDGRARAYVVAPGVEARHSILRPIYRVPERPWGAEFDGWETVAAGTGTGTWVLADQFRAGESVATIARWMDMDRLACEAALRWEALSRRVRVARVRRAVLGLA